MKQAGRATQIMTWRVAAPSPLTAVLVYRLYFDPLTWLMNAGSASMAFTISRKV